MRILVLMMLTTTILSSCRSANVKLSHTAKTYSPVFSYLPDGHIDSENSYCIVSAQHFSISGHEFLPVKTKESIKTCDRAIGYKGATEYQFFNEVAFEIQKGLGLISGNTKQATSSDNNSEAEE